jgi:hypothetical protein
MTATPTINKRPTLELFAEAERADEPSEEGIGMGNTFSMIALSVAENLPGLQSGRDSIVMCFLAD